MADMTVPVTGTTKNPFLPDDAPPTAQAAPDMAGAVRDYLGNTAQAARANVAISLGANPDYEAELSRLSKQTGVPIESARAYPEQVKQQAALSAIDFDQLAKQFPQTAAFYQDQSNARMGHDDIGNMTGVEKAVTALTPQPQFTIPTQRSAIPRTTLVGPLTQVEDAVDPAIQRAVTPDDYGEIRPINAPLSYRARLVDWARGLIGLGPSEEGNATGAAGAQAFIQQYAKDNGLTPADMRNAVGGMSEVPTQFAQGFYTSFLAGLAPDVNGPAQTTAGGVASGAGQLAGFVAGAPLRVAGAAVERLGANVLAHTGTESFVKAAARDVTAQASTLGLASGITAAGQALDQATPTDALKALGTAGLHGAEMGAVFGGLGRVLPDNTIVQTIARAVGTNTLMDAIQGTSPLDDRSTAQKVFDYGLNSLFALHGAGRAPGGWLRDAARADIATQDAATLQGVADAASASKLRERNADAFRDFVAQANADGPIQNVYVDAATLTNALAQSGVKMDDINATMPRVAEQLPQALATGGDVSIPLEDFATHIAGSKAQDAIMPHLKTDPDGMTLEQANEFHQSAVDQFTQAAQTAVADRANDDAVSQSALAVHDDVLRQLSEANRFTPDVNKVYAALVRDTYTAAGARAGLSPEAMYQRYPLRVAAEDVTGGNALDQPPIEPVATLRGDEIAAPGTDLKSLRSAAGDYYTQKLAGTTVHNDQLGDIQFTKRGMRKMLATSANPDKLKLVAALPDLLTNGAVIRSQENQYPDAHKNIVRYHWVRGDVTLDGKPVTVDVNVEEHRDGKLYYNHTLPGNEYFQNEGGQTRNPSIPGVAPSADRESAGGEHPSEALGSGSSDKSVAQSADGLNLRIVGQEARGRLSFADDITSAPSTITLARNADLSTFIHELGHFQLEMLSHMSRDGSLPEVGNDFKTVMDWFGTTPDAWRGMTLEQKRDYHEQFARGFEAYLFEGKAPSEGLRAVFQRVRAWMVSVYRSLRNLNVELSPEVRGVFDRLLATNDAIRTAEAQRAMAPMFETPEQANMTPEQFADYHRLGQEATLEASDELAARSLRDMRFSEIAKSRALREIKADVAAKRRVVRDEVAAQVAAEPVYQAENFIRRGELVEADRTNRQRKILDSAAGGSTKLSLADLKEMYGDGEAAPWRYLDTGKNGLAARDGMHPDVVAELFGFSSGDELVRKLLDAEPQKDVIEAATDQRMLERYGDITTPEAMNRAANEAIHNEVRTRFIATELKALAKATGPIGALTKAAREVAQNQISRARVRDISAAKYAAAEAKAARAADAALKKGDLNEAAAQKRNQLLNNQLERAARDAATEVTKGIAYLRKFDGKSKTIDPDYQGQIQALLDRFDLKPSTTLKELQRRESLRKWVEERTNEGLTPVIPETLLDEAYRKSYKDMTVDEMRGLLDSVRNIEHLGRLKQRLLTLADKREFDAFIEEAVETITSNAKKTLPDRLESNQLADKVRQKASRFLADHRTLSSLLQQMDGRDGGFLWDKIIRPMNERGDWEAKRRSEATKALREIFDGLDKTDLRQKLFIPEINNSLSKEGRLAVALNWGNETNQRRIMMGDKWSNGQVQAILKTLTKEDWAFVQKVWDHIDTYWPEIADKQYRVTGVKPEKVEAQPFVNPLGEQMRGGYYPIKYDPLRSTRAEELDEAATLKQMMGGAFTRATTRRGFTEARVEDVKRPVRKDLGVITNHVEEVLHDLAWHEWLIDTNRVLGSHRFGEAVREHYGPEVLATMKDTVKSIALGDVSAKHALEAFLAFLRKGTIVSRLGWNVVSALKQFAGYGPSAALIGSNYMRRGIIEYMGSAVQREHVTDAVYAKSDFMRLRGQTLNRDIREIRNQIDAGAHPIVETISRALPAAQRTVPALEAVKDSFLWMIEYTQRHVDVPTWLGAYRKGIDDFKGDEAKAVAYADQIVRDSQGSGLLADQPQIMRGGQLAKLFTTFYSALNAQYNLLAKAKGQGGVARLASAYMIAVVLPSLMTSLISTVRGKQGGTDDWSMEIAKNWFQELLGNTLGMGVGIRELSSVAQGFDYTGPTPLTPIADLGQFIKQAQQGGVDAAALRAANKLAGDILHYPAGLLDRIAEGYMAWQNGDASAAAMLIGKPTKQ